MAGAAGASDALGALRDDDRTAGDGLPDGIAADRTVSFFGLPLPRLIGPDKALGELLEEIHEIVPTPAIS